MVYAIVILSILIVFILTVLFLYIRNYNGLLEIVNEQEDKFKFISSRIEYSSKKLNEVDLTGHFEVDDEVGFFFKELKQIQVLLDEFNIIYYQKNDTDYAKRLNEVLQELRNIQEDVKE